jgi:hypothetical protein
MANASNARLKDVDPAMVSAAISPSTAGHREHRRHYTTLRVAKLVSETTEALGVVRNVSAGGMMIDSHASLTVGQVVTVSLFDGHHVEATIIWQKDMTIGLQFESPVDVKDLLAGPPQAAKGKRSRLPRLKADRLAIIDFGSNQITTVRLCDLSQRGARILTDKPLAANQDVWLWLNGVKPVRGTVRWYKDGSAGIAFHELLGVKELSGLLNEPPNFGQCISDECTQSKPSAVAD